MEAAEEEDIRRGEVMAHHVEALDRGVGCEDHRHQDGMEVVGAACALVPGLDLCQALDLWAVVFPLLATTTASTVKARSLLVTRHLMETAADLRLTCSLGWPSDKRLRWIIGWAPLL